MAAVPELHPRRHVLGALRILFCETPSVLVEHPVRAAQPFRLVRAGMQTSDRREEQHARPRHFPRHSAEDTVGEQVRLAQVARRLIVVVHLHHLRDRPVAVHVAPAARHEAVGVDGELHAGHVLLERPLAEPVAELVFAHPECLRAAGIETPVHDPGFDV